MRFISLFTGVGGMDLGLERAGWECVAQVENDEWCTRILNKHWPTVPKWSNIYDVTAEDLPHCDAVVGGFPCQPVSLAGKRQAQDDDRWLWPEFLRIVRHVRPRIVLVENVSGLFSAGFGDVVGGLAAAGYDAEWASIPAAAVGAPHLRWRVFIVAYPSGAGVEPDTGVRGRDAGEPAAETRPGISRGSEVAFSGDSVTRGADVADTAGARLERSDRRRIQAWGSSASTVTARSSYVADTDSGATHHEQTQRTAVRGTGPARSRDGEPGPIDSWGPVEPGMGRSSDGISNWLDGTWEHGIDRTATGVPNRVDRLKGLGNAVVPQVSEWIGRRISNTIGAHDG